MGNVECEMDDGGGMMEMLIGRIENLHPEIL